VFTSSYRNKSWLYEISREKKRFRVATAWSNNAQGYMSTPVVIDGHAYLHLGNRRFTCINLETGERTWTSRSFEKYASLVAQDDRILALGSGGRLLLIKADPKEFQLVGEVELGDVETWAHLAVSGDELFVRELEALSVYRWEDVKSNPSTRDRRKQ